MQLGAAPISSDVPVPSVDDLADQVADVLDFFRYCVMTLAGLCLATLVLGGAPPDVVILDCPCSLGAVMCLGVTAGAYVLTLFAVSVTREMARFWIDFLLSAC
jgi:hypothetical protein